MRRLGLLLGTLLLAGCSAALGGGSTVGGLGTLQPDAFQCSPLARATRLIEGSNALHNDGDKPDTITDVELTDAKGLTLTSSRLGPIGHHGKHGTFILGVQRGGADPAHQWMVDQCTPAVGATIRPGQSFNLLLFLKAPHGGQMGPPKVTYTEDGHTKVWNGGQVLVVPRGPRCVSHWEKDWEKQS